MRILVTGANGYIGQGVVDGLYEKGIDVVATDFHTESVNENVTRINANLFDLEDPYTYFRQPDICLHLAWRDGFRHNSETHLNDLPDHYAFIEKLCKAGIRKLAVMGSMHEIGFYEGCINENTACKPQSLYGIAKNALREATFLTANAYHVKCQWLRGYYIVGNTASGNSVFSKIRKAVEAGDDEFPFTKGDNQFDFIDYTLFCEQVVSAVLQEKILGIIECCSGKPVSLASRVEQFIAENGYCIRLKYGAFPDRPYDSKAVWGDNTKINLIMGNTNQRVQNRLVL